MAALAASLKPCGPVIDAAAAERARETLAETWSPALEEAWPALAPVFAAAPYLAGLARRSPEMLQRLLGADPGQRLVAILKSAEAAGGETPDAGARILRAVVFYKLIVSRWLRIAIAKQTANL